MQAKTLKALIVSMFYSTPVGVDFGSLLSSPRSTFRTLNAFVFIIK